MKLLILLSVFLCATAEAKPPRPKKYNLSICAIFKNETKYLKEWIEYHRLVGVDHFYLYSNNSGYRSLEVLKPYIKQNIVTLTHWPDCLGPLSEEQAFLWSLSTQIAAFENAILLRARETRWMAIVDVDEFLIPIDGDSLPDLLERYRDCPGIVLHKEFFDASERGALPPRHLVIESIDLVGAPKINVQKSVEKIIFKPELCATFTWPPFACVFKEGEPIQAAKRDMRVHHYLNRNRGALHSPPWKMKLFIDHRLLLEEEVQELLNAGYEIEDPEPPMLRFVPQILKKLGY